MSRFKPLLERFNMLFPRSISDEKINAISYQIESENIKQDFLQEFLRNWIKREDNFPTISQILKGVQQVKNADLSSRYQTKTGCSHEICDGSGWVILKNEKQSIASACTCFAGTKLKNINPYHNTIKNGFQIDDSDPIHRDQNGNVRKGVLEIC